MRWVLRHQTLTLLVTLGTFLLTVYLFWIVPKGFFPVQDTGVLLGITEAPQTVSFGAMSSRQQALATGDFAGPGCGERFVVHRDRRDELDAEQRAHSDQLEGSRVAEGRRRWR